MITLTGNEKKTELNVHQIAVDYFEVSVTGDSGNDLSVAYFSEKQIRNLAETLNKYLDI